MASRLTIHWGDAADDLLAPNESLCDVRRPEAAAALLDRLAADPIEMAALRRLLARDLAGVDRLTTSEVVRQLTARLGTHRMWVRRRARVQLDFPVDQPEEAPLLPPRPSSLREDEPEVETLLTVEEPPMIDHEVEIEAEPEPEPEEQVEAADDDDEGDGTSSAGTREAESESEEPAAASSDAPEDAPQADPS